MARKRNDKTGARDLLGELAGLAENLFSDGFETQCGALCYRVDALTGGIEVLLVTSRESGRWIIPKGWPMKGKSLRRAAEIEALEEAGVRGKARKKPFGYFTYVKAIENGRQAVCMVEVYLVEVTDITSSFREKGQRRIVWVPCVEAARLVREPELKGLLLKVDRTVRKN